MAQSPEYPDLKWMPPKSWDNSNRTSVQLIVIHDTEGSEGPNSAEDGAAYDQVRTDGTSTHYFHDSNSTVQCVRTEDQAHAARTQGNRRGIQHELCGVANQGAAGWADAVSQGTLRQAAKQVARDCKKWGIPIRRLTAAQVANGTKGICGHVEITYAFPQDNGTHTDPGPTFPWSQFLGLVRDLKDGVEDVAATQDMIDAAAQGLRNVIADGNYAAKNADGTQPQNFIRDALRNIVGGPVDQAAILAAINAHDDVDELALAAALIPGLTNAIIAALPEGALTGADVEAAVRNVLRTGVGG